MDDQRSWTPGEPQQPATPWSAPTEPAAPAPPPGWSAASSSYPPAEPSHHPAPSASPYAPPPADPASAPGPVVSDYAAPPAPGYPAPPQQYGYPGVAGPVPPYGQYPSPPQGGTDGVAVAALVVGIAGIAVPLVGPVVAIVLGAVALSRLRRSGRQGRGMAIAGISIGAAWIVLGILAAVAIPVFLNQRHEALHDRCADGDMAACDTLYNTSAEGSAEQDFGNTCGGRTEGGYLCTAIGDVRYGDDEHLDALWDACAGGDGASCDELSWSAEPGSDYAEYGLTCGDRTDGSIDCVDAMDQDRQPT